MILTSPRRRGGKSGGGVTQSGGNSKFRGEWLGTMPTQIVEKPYKTNGKHRILTPSRRRGGESGGGLRNREEIPNPVASGWERCHSSSSGNLIKPMENA